MTDSTEKAVAPEGEETLLGHPRGLWWLFVIEMWERWAFYGMRALFVLYLTKHFFFDQEYASSFFGAFAALVYLTPLIGGLLADKYLGSRKAVAFGAITMALGYFVLSFGGDRAQQILIYHDQQYEVVVPQDEKDASKIVIDGQPYEFAVDEGTSDITIKDYAGGGALPQILAKDDYDFEGIRDPFYVNLMLIALSIVVMGNGFFKPNISTMVGELYKQGDIRRDSGFTIFYMGINLGSFFSQSLCPIIAAVYGWNWGFLTAAIGMAASFVINEISRRRISHVGLPPDPVKLREKTKIGINREWLIYLLSIGGMVVAWLLLQNKGLTGNLLIAAFVISFLVLLAYSLTKCTKEEGSRMVVALVLILFSTMFWSMFEQAANSLTLFADSNVDKTINFFGLFQYEMPAGQVQVFNPLFVFLLAIPFSLMWVAMAKRNIEPNTPVKFSLGLVQVGLGFLIIVYGSNFADEGYQISLAWMALAYLLHTTGELCLSPVGLSMITKLSVARLVGLMMGMWFIAISMAQYVAGYISSIAAIETVGGKAVNPAMGLQSYPDVFNFVGWLAVATGVLLLLLSPILKKMMRGVH